MAPLGSGPREHPRLRGLDLPRLGWPHRGAPLLTKTLLFVSQEGPWGNMRFSEDQHAIEVDSWKVEPRLRAFDKATGELVAEIELPANGIAAPMTYSIDGRQYIAVSVGGTSFPSELVALSLAAGSPEPTRGQ
jgi:quinoprotein glucose dehydrogenase